MDETPYTSQPPTPSWNLPLTLLAFAIALFILAQVWSGGAETQGIEFQNTSLDETKTRLTELIKKNEKELEERKPLVAESEELQNRFKEDAKIAKDAQTSRAQFELLHKQIAALNKAVEDQKPVMGTVDASQKKFSKMLEDLLGISKSGDADATKILKDAETIFGLKVNSNPPPPEDKKAEDKKPEEKKPDDKKPDAPKTP